MPLSNVEEKKKIALMRENMYCKRYNTECESVPDEVLEWMYGLGLAAYECELDCAKCKEMVE